MPLPVTPKPEEYPESKPIPEIIESKMPAGSPTDGISGTDRALVDKCLERQDKGLAFSPKEAAKELEEETGLSVRNPEQRLAKSTSKAYLRQCLEDSGLSTQTLSEALAEDIKSKPGKRIKELKLGFELYGHLQRDPEADKPQDVQVIETMNILQQIVVNAQDDVPKADRPEGEVVDIDDDEYITLD